MRKSILVAPLLFAASLSLSAQPRETLPPGTNITVRTNSSIDMRGSSDGRIYTATIDQDVLDRDGRVVIPRGSNTELIVRNVARNDMVLDMDSIEVNGRRYVVSTEDQVYDSDRKDGVGKNSRTGKFVGAGAIAGAIIGAIAGGGKGAAIGALAGGGAGAGAQVATRGRNVRVPSESLLTFRLDRPLTVSTDADRGYDRGGRHYHYRP